MEPEPPTDSPPANQPPANQPPTDPPPDMSQPDMSQPGQRPAIRVSDRDRDAVANRLQDAFAEGRLDDDEFDQRMRAALTARLSTELAVLTTDLPDMPQRPASVPAMSAGPKPGRFAIAFKSSVRRGGRWRVPERFTSVIYKGSARLDLRVAELTGPATTVVAVAYKSHIDVLVPPGVRVELDGFGVSKGWSAEEDMERLLPANAPVVHVRGLAYKGTIEVSTRPPGNELAGRRS
jgi:Domain of unknown function (DUF1707)